VVALSVVRPRTVRAWTLVAAIAVVAVLVPRVPSWLPVSAATVDPATLRARILDSAHQPYQGYAEINGSLQLPELPNLADLTALLTTTTRVRTWYAAPDRWRFAVVSPVGERDVYGTPEGEFTWDYGANQLTRLVGEVAVRIPRAGDLTPPDLAQRVLTAAQDDPVTALPARRIAGIDAPGLRLTPRDPDTTVGHVDIWADPDTGVPLAVEVTAREKTRPVLTSRMIEFDATAPPEDVLTPTRPAGSGYGVVAARGINDALGALGRARPPFQLAGRDLRQADAAGVRGVGVYGTGLSAFIAVPVPGDIGGRALDALEKAGGTSEKVADRDVMLLSIPPLSIAVVRSSFGRRAWFFAGLTDTDVLLTAASEVPMRPWSRR
jgi:hypothetical protein